MFSDLPNSFRLIIICTTKYLDRLTGMPRRFLRRCSFRSLVLRAVFYVVLLGLLPFHGVAAEESHDELLYSEALRDLSNGETQSAIEKFGAIVQRHPTHHGALLDLALAYCQAGLPINAETLFARMAAWPDLPPAIGEVIKFYRYGACQPRPPSWQAFLAMGVGSSNNFNQAPDSGFLYLAPLGMTLQLADKSRPQKDSFSTQEAVLYRAPPDQGWGGGLFLQRLGYEHDTSFNSTTAQGIVSYRNYLGPARLDAQGALVHQTFNGNSHLAAATVSSAAMWPLFAKDNLVLPVWQAGGALSLSAANYPNLPDYRSNQVDIRARLQYQPSPGLKVLSDAGWVFDKALASRPGGNRQGPFAQLAMQWMPAHEQSLELLYRNAWLNDAQPYSSVFFGDAKRANRQASWYGAWRYRMSPQFQLRIEGRYGTSNDAVPLFSYHSSSVGLVLEWWPQ